MAALPIAAGAQEPRLPKPRDVSRMLWKPAIGLNGFLSVSRDHNTMHWEALEFASDLGFVGVELVNGWPGGFSYPDPDDTRRVDALRRLYDRYGIRILGIQSAPQGSGFSTDAAERDAWQQSMSRQALLVHRLGGDVLGHWPVGALGEQTVEQAVRRLAESCRRAADETAKLGVTITVEIEPVFAFKRIEDLIAIVHGANHPHVKAIYDPSHFDWMNGGTGRPEELVRRIGVKHLGHIQFCDTDGTLRGGGTSKHLPCGDGHVDIAANLDLLWRDGYRGWIMLDNWEIPDQFDALVKGKRALDAAMKRNHVRG